MHKNKEFLKLTKAIKIIFLEKTHNFSTGLHFPGLQCWSSSELSSCNLISHSAHYINNLSVNSGIFRWKFQNNYKN